MIYSVLNKNNVEISATRLTLRGFRNYAELHLELESGFNVVAGPNAQGKTNLLEAIYLVSCGRLLRGQRDAEAVRHGDERAFVEVEVAPHGTTLSIALGRGIAKRAAINGVNLPRTSDLLGRLPAVCVSTFDLEIVRGDPGERRLFLDLELSTLSPAYLRHLTLYKRAVEQRNAVLRDAREWPQAHAKFESWEEQIADHGVGLRKARMDYIERLTPAAAEVHRWMGGGEELTLTYLAKDDCLDRETFLSVLARTRAGDIHRGSTSIGPHRDDIGIEVGGKEARLYSSQGQQRTAVIALKFGTLETSREELGFTPLLLLDDMLSDLDQHRRALLVEVVLARAGQAMLTCTEAEAAGSDILNQARVVHVRNGTVEVA